ncbi:MAG: sensor histidine kinase [Myxococcota bacterium]
MSNLKRKYEFINNFRQKMVRVASHDLKSPLSTMEGYVNLLLEGYYGEIPTRLNEILNKIADKMKDMRELIEDILDVASIEKEGLNRELDIIDPTPIINELYKDNKIIAERNKIEISIECPEAIPPVLSNRLRFIQIMQNLISNALKFTPEGGTIKLKVIPREVDILFVISDSGSGIPAEDIPYIFEEFYRVGTVKRKVKGSGLGLYIVKTIIDAQGGKIWVESTVGKGTTFYFTLRKPIL